MTAADPVASVATTARRPPAPTGRRRAGRGMLTLRVLPFLAPALTLLVLFTYVPVANMLWYSLTDWDGLTLPIQFVGLDNYVQIATDPDYWQIFTVSLYYFAASIVQIALALYFATVLSFQTRFRNFFMGTLFLPYLLNGVAIGFVFLYLFQPGGTLDAVLGAVGAEGLTQQWLGDPDIANISLAATSVWRFIGLNFVLFLGAIQSISPELYEAADIDGANKWQQFRHIIAPGIKRIISLSLILAVSGSLSVFEIPFIMTSGANGTSTFVIETVQTAFTFRNIGLASALATVLLLLVVVVTLVQRLLVPDDKVDLT